jgi:putative tryptophan/tyrosine transport system substrate-binding protein
MRVTPGIAAWLAILAIALYIPSVAAGDATIPHVGVLLPPGASSTEDGLRQGLRELGYIEGESIIIDWRRAEGGYAEMPRLADHLVRSQVDTIVAGGDAASMAATQATTNIPVVFMSGDPISAGLTTNLSHPSGNSTGIYVPNTDLEAKRLELLLEVAQRARRVAYLRNPSNPLAPRFSEKVEHAAATLGVRVLPFNARNSTEVDSALKGISKKDVDAVLVGGDILFLVKRADIARSIHDAGVPAVFPGSHTTITVHSCPTA